MLFCTSCGKPCVTDEEKASVLKYLLCPLCRAWERREEEYENN